MCSRRPETPGNRQLLLWIWDCPCPRREVASTRYRSPAASFRNRTTETAITPWWGHSDRKEQPDQPALREVRVPKDLVAPLAPQVQSGQPELQAQSAHRVSLVPLDLPVPLAQPELPDQSARKVSPVSLVPLAQPELPDQSVHKVSSASLDLPV